MLVAMGVFRIGNLIRFIPKTVVIGFTNGIAVVIFLAQIKDFLGLQIEHMPGEFFGKVKALVTYLDTISIPTVALSVASLVVLLSWNRLARRYPRPERCPPCWCWPPRPAPSWSGRDHRQPLQQASSGLPGFAPAQLSLATLGKLISPALTIAAGAIDLSARVADAIDDRHDPNQGAHRPASPTWPRRCSAALPPPAYRPHRHQRAHLAASVCRSPGSLHALVVLLAVVLVFAPFATATFPLATLSAIVVSGGHQLAGRMARVQGSAASR